MSGSNEEVEDYMSDDFLNQLVQKDVKPGLSYTYSQKRKLEQHKLQRETREAVEVAKKLKSKNVEAERREEGLQKSLDESNKGFAMLQKMGFKPGQSLGKSSSGIKAPIPIKVKDDRGGLGREAVLKEIEEQKQAIRKKRLQSLHQGSLSAQEFRAHVSRQRRLKTIESDLYKSQKACASLDSGKEVAEPAEPWFWPKVPRVPAEGEAAEDVEEEEDECEFEPHEQLILLTSYLRREYFYCLWCGHAFQDKDDLSGNCPGSTREEHDE